jgi:DNA polymerase I-like protein with 3'-5' exonuclease and polymerase domains
MTAYVLDLETNGLLHKLDRVHCLVLRHVETGEVISCANQPGHPSIEAGLDYIAEARQLVGHNLLKFDLPVLRKLYPNLILRPDCDIYDTLVVSRLLFPEIESEDESKYSHIESKYKGRHSLAAWGERLGTSKIKFKAEAPLEPGEKVWDNWSAAMQTYCEGDTLVSLELYNYMLTQEISARAFDLEHEFCRIMAEQEKFGFPFNEKAAYALVNVLKARRTELDDQLQDVFPPIKEERISAKTGKPLKTKITVFNPGSRQQTAERLQQRYPEIVFGSTEKGNVKVDDDVLEKLGEKYPEAKMLAEYQLLNKRLGQIVDGKEAWLNHCRVYNDGRIHGNVNTNSCVSGRVSHSNPNVSQVPSVGAPFGAECRALFYAPEGWDLVGADASGLELRALAAWLAYFDDGVYAGLVSDPSVDIHAHNAALFGLYDPASGKIPKAARDLSKRLTFGVLYGAGVKKAGSIICPEATEDEQYRQGKVTIDTFYVNLPAIKQLKDLIDRRITQNGHLIGIDGRKLLIRSRHSALNQLLQSTGAILMKKATCIFWDTVTKAGLDPGEDFQPVGWFHDELQVLARPQHSEFIAKSIVDGIRQSGEYFELKCPFTGEYRIGKNWEETH